MRKNGSQILSNPDISITNYINLTTVISIIRQINSSLYINRPEIPFPLFVVIIRRNRQGVKIRDKSWIQLILRLYYKQ